MRFGSPLGELGEARQKPLTPPAWLEGRDWLAAERPTIADVALYSYLARAPEGNVDLSSYANVEAFLRRVESLPGFVPLAKTPAGLTAAG